MTVPWPMGSPQKPPNAQQTLTYLDQLGSWIDQRRHDLDRLDQKVRDVDPARGTQDMAMTLTVWQSIKDRYTDLETVWDSGRAGEIELKKLAVMTWANLNDMLTPGTTLSTGGGLALSLPEACRMLEALVTQLSSRYQLAPMPTEATARISQLRAQVERIREQAELDPPEIRATSCPHVVDLARDVSELIAKADRGGDIGGILGPLEVRAAQMERDLIVSHAQRETLAGKISQARGRKTSLIARETAVTELVRATQLAISPAPKYAVPHVAALGEIPTTEAKLEEYLATLDRITQAMDIVQQANLAARHHKDSLATRFSKAAIIAAPDDSLAHKLALQIEELLAETPTQVDVVEPLIIAFEASQGQR